MASSPPRNAIRNISILTLSFVLFLTNAIYIGAVAFSSSPVGGLSQAVAKIFFSINLVIMFILIGYIGYIGYKYYQSKKPIKGKKPMT